LRLYGKKKHWKTGAYLCLKLTHKQRQLRPHDCHWNIGVSAYDGDDQQGIEGRHECFAKWSEYSVGMGNMCYITTNVENELISWLVLLILRILLCPQGVDWFINIIDIGITVSNLSWI
jgi:hypothetical protein